MVDTRAGPMVRTACPLLGLSAWAALRAMGRLLTGQAHQEVRQRIRTAGMVAGG